MHVTIMYMHAYHIWRYNRILVVCIEQQFIKSELNSR